MAIEGLHNIIGIRPVNKEEKPGQNERKKKKKKSTKRTEKNEQDQKEKKGHIDIRI